MFARGYAMFFMIQKSWKTFWSRENEKSRFNEILNKKIRRFSLELRLIPLIYNESHSQERYERYCVNKPKSECVVKVVIYSLFKFFLGSMACTYKEQLSFHFIERLISSASKYSRYIFRGRNTQFSIGTKQKKGRVECLWEFQIFYQGIMAQIFEKIFAILKVWFHHEGGLSQSRYFELFFSTRYEAPPQKNQLWLSPPSCFSKRFA